LKGGGKGLAFRGNNCGPFGATDNNKESLFLQKKTRKGTASSVSLQAGGWLLKKREKKKNRSRDIHSVTKRIKQAEDTIRGGGALFPLGGGSFLEGGGAGCERTNCKEIYEGEMVGGKGGNQHSMIGP